MSDAVEGAFRDHYGRVYRFVRSRTANQSDAEDIVQSVFAEAAARPDVLECQTPPVLAWLYTVARRRLIDAARQRDRRGTPVSLDRADIEAPDLEYGPEVAAALRNALSELPASQRETLLLRLIEGRSFGEIAERSGSTEAACKMRFARGIAAVRARLEREEIVP